MSSMYETIPKDYAENILYRLKLRERASKEPLFTKALMQECKSDILFWVNAFCWLFEPRPRKDKSGKSLPKIIPFITWPHQDRAFLTTMEHLGFQDIGCEKSRAEGATWMFLMIFLHQWLFVPLSAFGLVSRNEMAVDNPEDPDSLMFKLDWELTQLPTWMVPKIDRNKPRHVLTNLDNKSTIVGYSATSDVGSGGRKVAFFMDELSKFPRIADKQAMDSTQHVTDCRIINSTPKGPSGAYYEVMHDRESSMVRIILDWRDNPTKNRGLYRIAGGIPVAVSPRKNPLPKDYLEKWATIRKRLESKGYDLRRDTERSPWYDNECLRPLATPMSIAQELDRDYGGSMATFFSIAMIENLLKNTRQPFIRGEMTWDPETYKPSFTPKDDGQLHLWFEPQLGNRPPATVDYIVGVDVSAGQGGAGGSNSTASVIERSTGVKVAAMATPSLPPERFADYCIALCNWFVGPSGPAYLIWEVNGYGAQFTTRVLETDFKHFHWRNTQDATGKKTKKAGFFTSRKLKQEFLGLYAHRLSEGLFTNYDAAALNEMKDYQMFADGKIEHIAATNKDDPSGAGESHGDRVIADALCAYGQKDFRQRRRIPSETALGDIPQNSFLARRREFEASDERIYW